MLVFVDGVLCFAPKDDLASPDAMIAPIAKSD